MKIYLHLLAAGLSKRFGSDKLNVSWDGKTLLEHSLARYISWQEELTRLFPDIKIYILVTTTAEKAERLQEQFCSENKSFHSQMPLFIINPHPEYGQAESIRLSITAAQKLSSTHSSYENRAKSEHEEISFDLFAVADQPLLSLSTLIRYTKWQRIKKAALTRLFDGKNFGNPCFFHTKFREELLQLNGDEGGRKIMQAHQGEMDVYYVPAKELLDIDLPEDWLEQKGRPSRPNYDIMC